MVWVVGPVMASVVDWEGAVDVKGPGRDKVGQAWWGLEDNEEGSPKPLDG